ncbi:MAG: oligosaccharide flippase family protein [Pseudomonadota bacterium]
MARIRYPKTDIQVLFSVVKRKISDALKGDSYKSRAVRSTAMVLLSFGGENFLRLASNLILTRLLFPEAFGLMALVQVVITGTTMFSDMGFRGAIVQDKRGDEPDFLNTAWTLQILRGTLLMLIVLGLANTAAEFYEEPLLAELLTVAAFVPFIGGFISTRVLTANRTLQLERLTFIKLGTKLVGVIIMVILAWQLQSVWALVIGNLIGPTLLLICSHTLMKGVKNRPRLEWDATKRLFRYGSFIFLASASVFFVNDGDRLILGKYISLEELAIYSIALLLASVPKKLSTAISSHVIFPLYARRPATESEKNRKNLNRARWMITTPLVLAAACFSFIGDPLVRLLYDVRYEAAGPVLKLIALAILPTITVQSYLRSPLASGHSGRYAAYQIAAGFLHLGLLLLLVPPMGILGAILTVPLSTLIIYPVMVGMIRPYNTWDPLHDMTFFGLSALLSLFVIWYYYDLLAPILAPLLTYIR